MEDLLIFVNLHKNLLTGKKKGIILTKKISEGMGI